MRDLAIVSKILSDFQCNRKRKKRVERKIAIFLRSPSQFRSYNVTNVSYFSSAEFDASLHQANKMKLKNSINCADDQVGKTETIIDNCIDCRWTGFEMLNIEWRRKNVIVCNRNMQRIIHGISNGGIYTAKCFMTCAVAQSFFFGERNKYDSRLCHFLLFNVAFFLFFFWIVIHLVKFQRFHNYTNIKRNCSSEVIRAEREREGESTAPTLAKFI